MAGRYLVSILEEAYPGRKKRLSGRVPASRRRLASIYDRVLEIVAKTSFSRPENPSDLEKSAERRLHRIIARANRTAFRNQTPLSACRRASQTPRGSRP